MFEDGNLELVLAKLQEDLKNEVNSKAQHYELSVDADEWVASLVDKYSLVPPKLLTDNGYFEEIGDTPVEVHSNRRKLAMSRNTPKNGNPRGRFRRGG